MIKSLSPYYINVPWVSPITGLTATSYTLEVFVWQGLKNDVPVEPNYSITKNNPEALTSLDKINIARLLNNFVDFTLDDSGATGVLNSENQSWIKTQIFYTTSNETEKDTPQSEVLQLLSKGYSYGNEGENAQPPADKVYIPNREYKVSRNSKFVFTVRAGDAVIPPPGITITNVTLNNGNIYDVFFTLGGSYSSLSCFYNFDSQSFLTDFDNQTSPQQIEINGTGSIDVIMTGFDNDSAQTVFSNTFNIVI